MPRKPGEKWLEKKRKRREKRYNTSRPARQKFYSSILWRHTRDLYRKAHPLCEECERQGRITPADLVDHIVPIEAGGNPLDWNNLQSLCHACHNKKHGKERAGGA